LDGGEEIDFDGFGVHLPSGVQFALRTFKLPFGRSFAFGVQFVLRTFFGRSFAFGVYGVCSLFVQLCP